MTTLRLMTKSLEKTLGGDLVQRRKWKIQEGDVHTKPLCHVDLRISKGRKEPWELYDGSKKWNP